MKKALPIALLAAATVFYFLNTGADISETNTPHPIKNIDGVEIEAFETKEKNPPPVTKQKETEKPAFLTKPNTNYSENFESIPVEDVMDAVLPRKHAEPIGGFSIKKNTIKSLFPNDTIALPEVNETTYTGKVKKRIRNSNGSITVIAGLEGEEERYYAVLTEGENSSFITIYSPEGNFELNSIQEKGYIYSTTSIDDALIDYKKTDTLKDRR